MAVKLPALAPIDYTALDFDSITGLIDTLIREHPEYFVGVDDFAQSNAGKFVIDLVSYIVDLLANRVDWVANELTLPTATQKQNVINLLKFINYRLSLPQAAAATVTASISGWVNSFIIPARYSIPAKDLDGNNITFEQFQKDNDKYIYEGAGSNYEFDTSFEVSPVLSQNDLVFYEGSSYQEFYTMQGVNNEAVQLTRVGVEEGSIRVWKVTKDSNGNILTKRELTETDSFISPEAQTASGTGLPPYKIQTTENDGAYIVFGETPVVEIFSQTGTDEIMVWYRVTKGSVGNITANSINYTTSILAGGSSIQISFLNTTSASGGVESESIENAKRYAPLSITTVEKTVNPDDFVVLLERNESILNSIAYGKSNEPNEVYTEYGYRIPPYETWIYSVYDKTGWENFATYSYPMEMRIGRPYVLYGLQDYENIKFTSGNNDQILTKLKYYSFDNDSANIIVSDVENSIIYTVGDDYVIDLEGRIISRISTGAILDNTIVRVQYYQNDKMDGDYILINFATSDIQDIPRPPIFTGIRTEATMYNFSTVLFENTVSENDFNWPIGDYYIDYENNQIIRNSVCPYLDSRISFGTSGDLTAAVNNEFIISFDGLNAPVYNSDHDFHIGTFNGWAQIGNGNSISYLIDTYSFQISVDGGGLREFGFTTTSDGIWTPAELATLIESTSTEIGTGLPFSTADAVVFADSITIPTSPILKFMSKTSGITSSVELRLGITYTDLFSLVPNLDFTTSYLTGTGEEVDILNLAVRCRATLNAIGLCNVFSGQELPTSNEEKPEIYSKSDINSPSAFTMTVSVNDTLTFYLEGTAGGTFDGSTQVTFNTVVTNSPYDLTTWQGKLNLIRDIQLDIDAATPGGFGQHVVEVFWLRQTDNHYRIGFRLVDTGAVSMIPLIKMEDDIARTLFQFSIDQSSVEGNLVEAKVSKNSDMVNDFLLRIELRGGFGSTAFIQAKANNALHNNTLSFLGFSDDQFNRGTQILQRTLIADDDITEDGALQYIFYDSGVDQNNRLNLNITSPITGVGGDGNYIIVIPSGTYNITQLIEAINTAFKTANFSGTNYNISSFMVCAKVEGENRIRIRMTDFDSTANLPNVEITDDDDADINIKCTNKLGFFLNQSMNSYSTIILSYTGDWNSDYDSDNSEATSIIKYLKNKRLISQDYLIKDPTFSTFDIKATVIVSKGFDRSLIEEQINSALFGTFRIDSREFAQPVAVSNVLKLISDVEGVDHTTIYYFGKDYQLYEEYINREKYAFVRATNDKKAEDVSERWDEKSAFKITLDGCTVSNINYDGEYLIIIGDNWTTGDYDELLNRIQNGDGGVGGLRQAIPLELGGVITNILKAVNVRHYEGIFEFFTQNEGPSVYMKFEHPENIYTKGYQVFNQTLDIIDSGYIPTSTYSIVININGAGDINYEITSPASGDWTLDTIAEQLDAVLPSTAMVGIDQEGKIRVTSLLGGNQSTIIILPGVTGTDLLEIAGTIETSSNGSTGYITCLGDQASGTLYIDPVEVYGLVSEPTTDQEFYNYMSTIESDYDEILSISDNYFIDGSTELESQKHGIILEYVEVGNT